jgi:hypothetical protein
VTRYRVVWVVAAVSYAAAASRFTPLTWPAMLATVPPAVVVCWLGLRGRSVSTVPAVALDRSQVMPWVVVSASAVVLEILALVQSPRADFPTLSSIVSPLVGDSSGWYRFAGYLAWFALGAWLVRR